MPQFIARLSWAQRFSLASLLILVSGMAGIGWWVCQQIQNGVVHQTGANTALYVSSIVEPNFQELGSPLIAEHSALLTQLLQANSLGQQITAVKIWDKTGRIVYATEPQDIGGVFPIDADLTHALHGWVATDIRILDKPENAQDAERGTRRLQTYAPLRRTGTDQVIGAVEFYQTVGSLDNDLAAAQRNSWLIVGTATIVMYLLLVSFVRFASDTIKRQQGELRQQVQELRSLHERLRHAARRSTTFNERSLRRISAELHDGPAQDLGFALLRLEHLIPQGERAFVLYPTGVPVQSDFHLVKNSLRHALQEIRGISSGMGLPELEHLDLAETAARAVRAHERRTATRVTLRMTHLPANAPLPVKITVYRIIQEALSNAYRHADGVDQQVHLEHVGNQLQLCVSDGGPGFNSAHEADWDEHLGLVGMRERVASLGGTFKISSQVGQGTQIHVCLALDAT